MGKMIVIEGTDGSGKKTQSKLLVDNLLKLGYKSVYLSFPMYETPTGKIIGGALLGKKEIGCCIFEEGIDVDPHIASLYYAADRKYNIKIIKEYLDQDYFVIVDRYVSSNMAHQGSKIEDKEQRFSMFQWIDKLEYWLLDLPKANMTFYLHVPYSKTIELMQSRENLDVAESSPDHLRRAEITYNELSELYNWNKIKCYDYDELRSIEDISCELLNIVLDKEKRVN